MSEHSNLPFRAAQHNDTAWAILSGDTVIAIMDRTDKPELNKPNATSGKQERLIMPLQENKMTVQEKLNENPMPCPCCDGNDHTILDCCVGRIWLRCDSCGWEFYRNIESL